MSTENEKSGRKPDLYACPERDANKDYFNRLGAAWERDDGGWNVHMDSMPFNGRFVLRKFPERVQEMKDNARDGERREEKRDEKRDDKRSTGREDRSPRDAGPRYER